MPPATTVRRTAIPPVAPNDKQATVTETKVTQYVEPKPETKPETTDSTTGDQTRTAPSRVVFANQNENVAPDKLSAMFDELRSSADYDGEQFYACITRVPDHMNDKFNSPCNSAINFAVLPFSTTDIFNFIPQIQRYNGNSGGRFKIRITDQSGEDLEIGLSNYVIANPPIAEATSATASNAPNGDIAAILAMMQEQNQHQNQMMLNLINSINAPKADDEFTAMVKEKMRNDFLNPPEKKSTFDPQEFASKILESQVMMQSITTMLTNTMQNAGGGNNQDKGIILSLLENEKVMDIVGNTIDNVTNIAGDIALAKAGADSLQPNPQQQQPDYVEQAPEPSQPTPEQIAGAAAMKDITSRIVTALLGENVIDAENATLKELSEQYPQYMPMITVACKGQKFEQVYSTLLTLAPDQFASVATEDQPRLETRLKELYEYLRSS